MPTSSKQFWEKPDYWPPILGWFEILAGAYIGYIVLIAGTLSTSYTGDGFNPMTFVLYISPMVLAFSIFMTTRRFNNGTYWITLVLLMTPTLNLVRGKTAIDIGAGILPNLPLIMPLTLSLGAALLLLSPSAKAWISLKRAERQEHKHVFVEARPITLFESRHKEYRRVVAFKIKQEALQFIDTWWKEAAQDEQQIIDRQWVIDIPADQKLPLILELRKANKEYSNPEKSLDTELAKCVRATFESANLDMNTILQFLVGAGIPGRLLDTVSPQTQEKPTHVGLGSLH